MNHKANYFLLMGLALLFAGVFFFTTTAAIQAESEMSGKIAYVDLWAIFNAHPQKAAAEEALNQVAQSMQSELETRASKLPEEEQQNLLKEYQGRLSQQEEGLIQEILTQIREAVKKVAAGEGIRIVLDKQSVIYGGYDLTEDVIDYIETRYQQGDFADNSGDGAEEEAEAEEETGAGAGTGAEVEAKVEEEAGTEKGTGDEAHIEENSH